MIYHHLQDSEIKFRSSYLTFKTRIPIQSFYNLFPYKTPHIQPCYISALVRDKDQGEIILISRVLCVVALNSLSEFVCYYEELLLYKVLDVRKLCGP